VVVGREAGTKFFPSAGLRIELRSDEATRLARKAVQLEREVADLATDHPPDSSEPLAEWPFAGAHMVIDTTDLAPASLLERVSTRIEADLRWPRRRTGEKYE
jgi:cytidylate kinase